MDNVKGTYQGTGGGRMSKGSDLYEYFNDDDDER